MKAAALHHTACIIRFGRGRQIT